MHVLQRVPPEARFWRRVAIAGDSECWEWLTRRGKRTNPNAYGTFYANGRTDRSPRWAWQFANRRPIPQGMHVLHSCDRPNCVNPQHLRIGTVAENMADRDARGRNWLKRQYELGRHIRKPKLTAAKVREIRARVAAGESQHSVARAFKVSQPAVSAIVHRRSWARLDSGDASDAQTAAK